MTPISVIPRIVCAAVRHRDGRIVCGPRHFDATMWQQIMNLTPAQWEEVKVRTVTHPAEQPPVSATGWYGADEGFIDQHGKFLTREQAWRVADFAGQIIGDRGWQNGRLHSEHLY